MPRRPRLFIPACFYHIMARGIDGTAIFRDDADRKAFLSMLALYLARVDFRCYAWCLLSNHYHLLVRSSARPLADLMKPLNSRYAGYFNRRHGRKGYLFQDRFKSVATQDQGYVVEIVRYVHLNPVRAGVCTNLESLDGYAWCGHGAIMGKPAADFHDVECVLRRFDSDMVKARNHYREFLSEGIGASSSDIIQIIRRPNDTGRDKKNTGLWVLGDRHFVQEALATDKQNRLNLSRYAREGWNVERLAQFVASRMDMDPASLLRRSRGKGSVCRKVFAFLGYRVLGFPIVELARYLGVGGSAVSMMLDEGEQIARRENISFVE